MTTKRSNKQPKDFDVGESAALVILREVDFQTKQSSKGISIRHGERGRLGPWEQSLGAAIMAYIDEGPESRVIPAMMELYFAASCALSSSPEEELFSFLDDVLDIVAQGTVGLDGEPESNNPAKREKAGVVLKFPTPKRKSDA